MCMYASGHLINTATGSQLYCRIVTHFIASEVAMLIWMSFLKTVHIELPILAREEWVGFAGTVGTVTFQSTV